MFAASGCDSLKEETSKFDNGLNFIGPEVASSTSRGNHDWVGHHGTISVLSALSLRILFRTLRIIEKGGKA